MSHNAYLICRNNLHFSMTTSTRKWLHNCQIRNGPVLRASGNLFYPVCDHLGYTICKLMMFLNVFIHFTDSDRVRKIIFITIPFMVKADDEV